MDSVPITSIVFGDGNRGNQVAINYGTINLPPERPETPPPPQSTLTFNRDPDFVGRETLLDQIHEKSSVPRSRIALVGIGGVGKSQIAIEYCYRVQDQSPETWVLWIHASNSTRFDLSCRYIADRDWLHDKNRKWVLVLDNLDDDQLLHEMRSEQQDSLVNDQRKMLRQPLWEYFPQTLNGSIIVTSRSRSVALHTAKDSDIIPVEPMDETCAATLFEKKLGLQTTREEVNQLTKALDFMPLAIVQAAVYIKQRSPRLSVVNYLEKFRKSHRQKTRLLHYYERDHRRDMEANHSILTTWQISFNHIQKIRPTAADLLSLMSFFDRQGIHKSLLREGKEMKHDIGRSSKYNKDQPGDISDGNESANESIMEEFEEDIFVLKDYFLISISADETVVEIHQLVQLAIQEWLQAQGKLENWKDQFIQILSSKLPDTTLENWQIYQLLLAHVQSAVTHQPLSRDSLGNWASMLYTAAWFAETRGDYNNCQEMAAIAKATRVKLFGPEDERTLSSFEQLGNAYVITGPWLKAEELQLHVLNTRNKVLGPRHHNTLSSMSSLACTYRIYGQSKRAEALQTLVVDIRQQVFGPKDLSTLASRGCLASIYNDQGRWKEAEALHKQVVDTFQQVLGLENFDTLNCMNTLANIYRDQGRLKEAEVLQVQVLHAHKKVLGQKHRTVQNSMRDLGSTYYDQGRWKEAEELWVQALDLNQQSLGPRHPSTLNSMVNLASNYYSQGRWKEAEELTVRVLNIRKQDLGPEHRDTLDSMNNLAFTRWSLGQGEDALLLMTECARLFDRNLGSDHPLSKSTRYSLKEWQEMIVSPSLRYIPRHMSATLGAFPTTFGLTSI
ncbi:Tetratricopeptide-like helical [Penicillium frequentans]|uniref:Tetratricopeptide-like helical n=1 Tax=Penicillium frequentans TaxID=3151616 RepID=A0AAD6CNF8_9EURO|nr:Tetratricopeptide-like helical [Penicillium glabrum]